MLEATGGANTHKGLIYALGLLLCAMGQTLAGGGENYINHARQLANIGLPEALRRAKAAPCSHGERIYAHRGVLGARGEAAAGFPHAVQALEALRRHRRGASETQARLLALVTSMAQLTDTNLLHRGGEAGLHLVQREARRILDLPLNQLEDALQKKPSFSLLLNAKQETSRLLKEDTEERQVRQMLIRRQRSDPQKPKHFQR